MYSFRAAKGFTEVFECGQEFLSWLKGHGMQGVSMITGEKAAGIAGAIPEVFLKSAYQRSTVHYYRSVLI